MKPPRHSSSRPLSDDDRRVWKRVTRTVRPKTKASPDTGAPAPSRDDFAAMMRVPPRTPDAPPRPGPLEPTAAKTVRRGRVQVDSKVDLHDLRLDEAYPALARALVRASNRNHRCVLVVTGKGRRVEGVPTGKIRSALPGWLAGEELRPLVATYAPAHIRHGGEGAWYVFLKQARDS